MNSVKTLCSSIWTQYICHFLDPVIIMTQWQTSLHFYELKLNSWNWIHFIQLLFFCSSIFFINAFCFRTLSLKLSRETLNNGSLYLHLFVLPRQVIVKKWSEASKASDSVYTRVALSHYQVPSSATYQLLSGKNLSRQCTSVLYSWVPLIGT